MLRGRGLRLSHQSTLPIPSAVSQPLQLDALILGGGVSGLWTLARLRAEGYSTGLIESTTLGATQSIAAQGIIHGGVKYALTGDASAASKAIAAMPERWASAIRGEEVVDLRGVQLLSPCTYLWTTPGVIARLAGVAASKVLRTPVEHLPPAARPPVFATAPRGVDVYRADEPVLDMASVLRAMSEPHAGHLWRASDVHFSPSAEGVTVTTRDGDSSRVIHARHVFLLAGPGNEALLASARAAGIPDVPQVKMQRRPLHMVMVRGELLELFGHCLSASSLPRLTVTSSCDRQGRTVWALGGSIAESGVTRQPAAQIEAAHRELAECVPWVKTERCQWATRRWDRAEGLTPDGSRPDVPMLATSPRVSVGWPTKMVFAPAIADMAFAHLHAMNITPRMINAPEQMSAALSLPHAAVAPAPADDPATIWT